MDKVRTLVADQRERYTFLCGGSRNFSKFQDRCDAVFVLEIDLLTLHRRLDQRPADEFGARQPERDLIVRLLRTKEDTPKDGILIDATAPLTSVVDEIVGQEESIDRDDAVPADPFVAPRSGAGWDAAGSFCFWSLEFCLSSEDFFR